MTSVGVRVSLKVVKPARSANSALIALLATEPRDIGPTLADPLRHDRGQVRTKGGIESSDLAGRLREQRRLVVGGSLATEGGQHAIGRLAAGLGAGDAYGAGVPPVDPCGVASRYRPPNAAVAIHRADTRVAPRRR